MHRVAVYILLLGFLSACAEPEPEPEPDFNWTKIDSSNFGQNVAIQEEIDIKLFLELHKDWKMTATGSGLQYYIYKKDNEKGKSPKYKEIAEIEYEISLLDGTVCYKTPSTEYEEVVVDHSNVESGVQEAMKIMKVGDHAKLIIPSHIAHGVVGDLDKIPPLTTLVIDIHLLGIK